MNTSTHWISVKEAYPKNGQRVLARYEGIENPHIAEYYFDGVNHHFGFPSHPITHWCPIPK